VGASRPAARPAHSAAHLIDANLDAAPPCGFLFGGGNPTDPLVSRERGDVQPKAFGNRLQFDGLSEISRELMNRAVS